MKNIEDIYLNLFSEIENIDYTNYRGAYSIAKNILKYSTETALIVMINIIKSNPLFFEETIRDSIYIYVYMEGNRSTCNYIKELLSTNIEGDVRQYLEDLLEELERKYIMIGPNETI